MKKIKNMDEYLLAKVQGILVAAMTACLWISPFLPWNAAYVEEWSKATWMFEGCALGACTVLVIILNLIAWFKLDVVRKTESND